MMGKHLNLFRILYLILLLFVFANFVLGYNGYCLYSAPVESLVVSRSCDSFLSYLVSLFIELTQSIGRM